MGGSGEPVIRSEQHGNAAVVRIEGDIDMSGSPRLRETLREVIAMAPRRVVVDLSEVAYMDSSGLATMVEAMKNAGTRSIRFALLGMTPRVRAIFEIARLDQYFPIVGTMDEAMAV